MLMLGMWGWICVGNTVAMRLVCVIVVVQTGLDSCGLAPMGYSGKKNNAALEKWITSGLGVFIFFSFFLCFLSPLS